MNKEKITPEGLEFLDSFDKSIERSELIAKMDKRREEKRWQNQKERG